MGPNYVDGIGSIRVANGVAHIDLVTLIPPPTDGAQPKAEVTQRLVMTLPLFVRMCAEMAGQLQRMEERGIITRNKPAS